MIKGIDKCTLLAWVQRALLVIFDWRTLLRCLIRKQKNKLDVVFISNMRHQKDRDTYLGKHVPSGGHFNGPRISFRGILGRTRALNVLARDLYSSSFREMSMVRKGAKVYYLNAARWASQAGAKVILSGASLKDLFGKDVREPKEQNPGIIFTKGDNGTVILFWRQIHKAFQETGLSKDAKLGFVCPYNTNGKGIIHFLVKEGYSNVILFGSKPEAVKRVSEETGYPMVDSYTEMGQVDAVICCSHSEDVEIGVHEIDSLRKEGKRLLIMSVTQPPNPRYSTYLKRKNQLIVANTGNGYAKKQRYVLGNIAARMFGFASQRWNFGCYMESIALAYVLKNGITKYGDLREYNWFDTNEEQMLLIEKIFNEINISPFPMACYTKPIKSFMLDLEESKNKHLKFPRWKLNLGDTFGSLF